MANVRSDTLVFCLGNRDTYLHAGPAKKLLDHGRWKDKAAAGLEFYRADGTPLEKVSKDGRLVALKIAGRPTAADRADLYHRVNRSVERMFIRWQTDIAGIPPGRRFPINGFSISRDCTCRSKVRLRELIAAVAEQSLDDGSGGPVAAASGPGGNGLLQDTRGWFHNLGHKI